MVFSNGSIALDILNGINPFPSNVSGILINLVNNSIYFVENQTGDTLGTTSIADKYRPALTDFSMANVLKILAVQDMGVKSVSVGDINTDNSNLMEMANQLEQKGYIELRSLTKVLKFGKARG